ALERAEFQEAAEISRVTAETESLRNTLLASISHDLRTPLAVITGASSALNDSSMAFSADTRRDLTAQIEIKAKQMSETISNVLDLMRLESGHVALRLDWLLVEDILNSALERLGSRLADHPVTNGLPPDLPPVHVDGALLLQVFSNILENVARHTPAGTRVTVSASFDGAFVTVNIDDTGAGLPPGDPERLFAKFHRGLEETSAGGAGLGLSICRAIVNAHGGSISAMRRPDGARFTFSLSMT
ncbi:MAG TPA: ATP-binding protein, partial [Steroidobacteraceae bacterium]